MVLPSNTPGNWTFAAGGNIGAAIAQGVNVKKVKLINFVISGVMAALAGTIIFAQRRSMYELLGIDRRGTLPHPQGLTVPVTPSAESGLPVGGLLKEIM